MKARFSVCFVCGLACTLGYDSLRNCLLVALCIASGPVQQILSACPIKYLTTYYIRVYSHGSQASFEINSKI